MTAATELTIEDRIGAVLDGLDWRWEPDLTSAEVASLMAAADAARVLAERLQGVEALLERLPASRYNADHVLEVAQHDCSAHSAEYLHDVLATLAISRGHHGAWHFYEERVLDGRSHAGALAHVSRFDDQEGEIDAYLTFAKKMEEATS